MFESNNESKENHQQDLEETELSEELESHPTGDGRLVPQSLRLGASILSLDKAREMESLILNIQSGRDEKIYTIGMVEPTNQPNVQKLADELDVPWRRLVITRLEADDFRELFSTAYGIGIPAEESLSEDGKKWQDVINFHKETENTAEAAATEETHSLGDKKAENPKELGEQIIRTAIEQKSSDIHFDMGPTHGMVRIRIDGCLYSRIQTRGEIIDFSELPNSLVLSVCGAFAAKAGIDFNDMLNSPQDSSFVLPYTDSKKQAKKTRIRFASLPRVVESGDQRGVKVTLRINQDMITDINQLGAHQEVIDIISKGLLYNGGIGLFAGPTGSGKTNFISSAHTLLRKDFGKNIMEYNDTIEQMFDGVCQTETSPSCDEKQIIKSWLRHDPDTLIASEIRDGEAAEKLVEIAVAGKLILSTIHVSSMTEIFQRLSGLGINRSTQSETLRFVIFTTLVRRLCVKCREKGYNLRNGNKDEFEYISSEKGCVYCNFRGYRGRTSVAEALVISPEVSEWIDSNMSGREICRKAEEAGYMFPLSEAIRRKVYVEKVTSRAEILRVIDVERRIVQNRKQEKHENDGWRDQPSKKATDNEPAVDQAYPNPQNQPQPERIEASEQIIDVEEIGENDYAIQIDEQWNLTDEEINRSVEGKGANEESSESFMDVFKDGEIIEFPPQEFLREIKPQVEVSKNGSQEK